MPIRVACLVLWFVNLSCMYRRICIIFLSHPWLFYREISTLLARSFFMSFSLTILALLARLRVLVQQVSFSSFSQYWLDFNLSDSVKLGTSSFCPIKLYITINGLGIWCRYVDATFIDFNQVKLWIRLGFNLGENARLTSIFSDNFGIILLFPKTLVVFWPSSKNLTLLVSLLGIGYNFMLLQNYPVVVCCADFTGYCFSIQRCIFAIPKEAISENSPGRDWGLTVSLKFASHFSENLFSDPYCLWIDPYSFSLNTVTGI